MIEGVALILSNQAHCFKDTDEILFPVLQKAILVDKIHFADTKSWYYGMELFNRTSQETAEKYSIPFVDQQVVFKEKSELFLYQDTVHMTPEGIELKARLFFNKIVELRHLEQLGGGQ